MLVRLVLNTYVYCSFYPLTNLVFCCLYIKVHHRMCLKHLKDELNLWSDSSVWITIPSVGLCDNFWNLLTYKPRRCIFFVSNHKDCPQYRMSSQTNLHICILVFVKKSWRKYLLICYLYFYSYTTWVRIFIDSDRANVKETLIV